MNSESTLGIDIYTAMRGEENARRLVELSRGTASDAVIADFTIDFVYGQVWGRDGLDQKQRSLVTIGILIALRQVGELENHLKIGLNNGLTLTEIEEAIIQAAPYAGFPAAWSAAKILADHRKSLEVN
ncbi:carboxymuconolactone decarboxylase family protein [Rhizobium sp. RAF36]|uniref:carboxymuconolactone decarboxylase family protein n=1 Tax=Rhizobium sp. RAF36 TaxID=3233055 RepID=UPI003F9B56FF